MNRTGDGGPVHLEWDCFGDRRNPPVVLIMGLGAQMLAWRRELCEALADRGCFVVRFDNRDAGLSSRLERLGAPSVALAMLKRHLGLTLSPAYQLEDMAADVVGLLDALGLPSAHIVGASMGGMIAQLVSLRHRERVRSLCSWMSTNGDPSLPGPTFRARRTMLASPPADRDRRIAWMIRRQREVASPPWFDPERAKQHAIASIERAWYPDGAMRQLHAILAAPSRAEALRTLEIPTSVLHGTADPLVPLPNGIATAACIPDAELFVFDDVGHDIPEPVWPLFLDAIVRTVRRGEDARSRRLAA